MPANLDVHSTVKVVHSILPDGNRAVTQTGSTVDRIGYKTVAFVFGYGGITDGTWTPSLEDSPDNSVWTAVPAAKVKGALTPGNAAGSNTTVTVSYVGARRYVRAKLTMAGATTGGKFSAYAVLGGAAKEPVV